MFSCQFALYPVFLFTLHCITVVLFTSFYLSDSVFCSSIRLFSSQSYGFFYFTCPQQAAPDVIADLKKELVLLRQKHDAGTVDSALGVLRQLLARPAAIFDPHASLAALEQLVDLAREKGDERANRFGIVLRQTRTLLYNP